MFWSGKKRKFIAHDVFSLFLNVDVLSDKNKLDLAYLYAGIYPCFRKYYWREVYSDY